MIMVGAKFLKASKRDLFTEIIPVREVYTLKDDLNDPVFFSSFEESMKTKGMVYPIIICTAKDFVDDLQRIERRNVTLNTFHKYRCIVGNNRMDYALKNKFEYIDAYVVSTVQEYKTLLEQTFIEPSEF